ncbi:aminotransferase class V-fold PLP-dependent enzyme [Alkalibacter rhizosphaerae]|uniref:cysteine desulfurase n=1 Tax=Alkalibacter rhizosphaerae TaxID=2815577 RepID=A0A974XIP9_9FIRM|nr:aminotransferase class V-fold PLP-dependent enzyme [Alkalibacter rhizosphaerae]QSX09093.1 aminotransferase class V-fold PLP-dependent enzyme [Alkalibacter rhizosphaerae]
MIYFDNAATSLHRPPEVIDGMVRAMKTLGSPGRGSHDFAHEAARTLYEGREVLSDFFHVGDPLKVVLTANATESLNMVIQGALEPGDHCITSEFGHNSVLRPLHQMEERGVHVEKIGARDQGILEWETLEQRIRPETKMVVACHGSNVTGNAVDLRPIGELCRKHGLLFVVDAAQTAGLLAIDFQELKIDALCLSGHKGLLGPQGIGVLCLSSRARVKPLKWGGTGTQSFSSDMPEGLPEALEAGTMNTHGLAGLMEGCRYLNRIGVSVVYEKSIRLANMFYHGLLGRRGITFYGDFSGEARLPIVSLNVGEMDAGQVSDLLAEEYGIATRSGAHCAPGVHRYFGTERQGMVRFSFSHFNAADEVMKAVEAVQNLTKELL